MYTSDLRFPGYPAAADRCLIRWELFRHPAVRDVIATDRPDTLRVLHRGPADPQGWSTTLRFADFPVPELVATRASVVVAAGSQAPERVG